MSATYQQLGVLASRLASRVIQRGPFPTGKGPLTGGGVMGFEPLTLFHAMDFPCVLGRFDDLSLASTDVHPCPDRSGSLPPERWLRPPTLSAQCPVRVRCLSTDQEPDRAADQSSGRATQEAAPHLALHLREGIHNVLRGLGIFDSPDCLANISPGGTRRESPTHRLTKCLIDSDRCPTAFAHRLQRILPPVTTLSEPKPLTVSR